MAGTYPENAGVATSDEILQAKMEFFFTKNLFLRVAHSQRALSGVATDNPGKKCSFLFIECRIKGVATYNPSQKGWQGVANKKIIFCS